MTEKELYIFLKTFQSTLPHGERHVAFLSFFLHLCISIHAPAWGATGSGRGTYSPFLYFNPRSRMGSDGRSDSRYSRNAYISIHAPAWGATLLAGLMPSL